MSRYLFYAKRLLRLFPQSWRTQFEQETLETFDDVLAEATPTQAREYFWRLALSLPRCLLVSWAQWRPSRAEAFTKQEAGIWWLVGTALLGVPIVVVATFPGLIDVMFSLFVLMFLAGQLLLLWTVYRFTGSALKSVQLAATQLMALALFGILQGVYLPGGIALILLADADAYLFLLSLIPLLVSISLAWATLLLVLLRRTTVKTIKELDAGARKSLRRMRNGVAVVLGLFLLQFSVGTLLAADPIPESDIRAALLIAPERKPESNGYRWLVSQQFSKADLITDTECPGALMAADTLDTYATFQIVDFDGSWQEREEIPQIEQMNDLKRCLKKDLVAAQGTNDHLRVFHRSRQLITLATAYTDVPTIITSLLYVDGVTEVEAYSHTYPELVELLPSRSEYQAVEKRARQGEAYGSARSARRFFSDEPFDWVSLGFRAIPYFWEINRTNRAYVTNVLLLSDLEKVCAYSDSQWKDALHDARKAYLGPLGVNVIPYIANWSAYLLERDRSCELYQKLPVR